MKTVRTFGNLAEAGFASSLLEAAGIHALLADEQTFTIGYGIATGGLRLQVDDADFERAGLVLEKGPDAASVTPAGETAEFQSGQPPQGRIPIAVFLVGAVLLAVMFFAARSVMEQKRKGWRSVEQTYDFDYNHDGKADHFYTYLGNRWTRVTVDRNFDGKIDEWEFSDAKGIIERYEGDDNFDGKPDRWTSYKNGAPVSSKTDTDFNGRVDWLWTFENGIVSRGDSAPNESSPVYRRLFYANGDLREEWVDENRDGTFDYKILHDPFGATSAPIPIEPTK